MLPIDHRGNGVYVNIAVSAAPSLRVCRTGRETQLEMVATPIWSPPRS
jgi:hypothetical protein